MLLQSPLLDAIYHCAAVTWRFYTVLGRYHALGRQYIRNLGQQYAAFQEMNTLPATLFLEKDRCLTATWVESGEQSTTGLYRMRVETLRSGHVINHRMRNFWLPEKLAVNRY